MKKHYPTNRSDNLEYRARVTSKALQDPRLASAVWSICADGEDGFLYWLNVFAWVYEPRQALQERHESTGPHLPFVTYGYQDEYARALYKAISKGEDLLTEKSRDMGASWLVLSAFLWFWLFGGPGNDFLLGSRKEAFVDKIGDMDSLVEKLRYQIKRQPKFLQPDGFNIRHHAGFMKIINPQTSSSIVGEANNKFFGTGGRKRAVLFDEFAKWEHTDDDAWQSCSDVTDCKLPISSANGTQNKFYRLRSQEDAQIEVHRMHWNDHPQKDAAWYEREKTRRDKEDLAAEVDIDYTASVRNKAYKFEYNRHVVPVPYDPLASITLMADFNIDPMCWALAHESGPMCRFFGELKINDTSTEAAAIAFVDKYADHEHKELEIYGDASGQNRGRQVRGLASDYDVMKNIFKRAGWRVTLRLPNANPLVADSLKSLNKRLEDYEHPDAEGVGKSWVEIDPSCTTLIDSFQQTKRKDDGIDKKDNIEHMTDGPRYWADEKYPIKDRKVTYDSAW